MLDKFDKNKSPFKVPDNYFAELTDNIMNSLPKENVTAKRIPLWKKTIPWVGVAASLIAIFFAVGSIKNVQMNTMAHKIETADKISDKNLVYNFDYDEEDYFTFLEEESAGALYLDALMFDE